MSNLYTVILAVHVLVAVLGIGSIASVAIVAAIAREAGRGWTEVSATLNPLLRYSAFSLAAMLVTGVLLDLATSGAFRRSWWFRGSGLLLLTTGALHAMARRTLRRGPAKEETAAPQLRRIADIAYGMCALIAVITVLMEVKPF